MYIYGCGAHAGARTGFTPTGCPAHPSASGCGRLRGAGPTRRAGSHHATQATARRTFQSRSGAARPASKPRSEAGPQELRSATGNSRAAMARSRPRWCSRPQAADRRPGTPRRPPSGAHRPADARAHGAAARAPLCTVMAGRQGSPAVCTAPRGAARDGLSRGCPSSLKQGLSGPGRGRRTTTAPPANGEARRTPEAAPEKFVYEWGTVATGRCKPH